MTGSRTDEVVHQIFFGWSYSDRQVDVLAHSFSSESDARGWLKRLEAHIRLQPVPGTSLPSRALSYIDFEDGWVAVVRRVNIGYTDGRNNSHALIGTTAVIDVSVALSLDKWKGWSVNSPQQRFMQAVSASQMASASDGPERLRTQAAQRERELGVALTKLLDEPAAPLSIIGCPEEDRLAMVWGLHAAADDHLSQRWGLIRRWSFSTYEDRHDVSIKWLPEIVFLPAKPEGVGVVERTIVDLARESAHSRTSPTATQLLARVLYDAPFPAEEPIPETVLVHSGPGFTDGASPSQPYVAPPEPRPVPNDGAPGQQPRVGGVTAAREASDHGAVQGAPHPAAILLNAGSVRELNDELDRLMAQGQQNRVRLRAALDPAAMDTIVEFVEIKARRELLDRLLMATYGRKLEDLPQPDALNHAAKLVKSCNSEQLAMMLGRAAARRNMQTISNAAFDRWSAGGHPNGLIPTGRAAQILWWARRSRRYPVVATVATIAVLAVAVLAGYLMGRPAPAQPAAPTTAAGTTAPSTPSTQAVPPTNTQQAPSPPTGKVPIRAGENQEVFAFAKEGITYRPLAPCAPEDNQNWLCPKSSAAVENPAQVVAIVVPVGQVQDLRNKSASGQPAVKKDWGTEVAVP